ncbi:MAG: cob(I)yrinic acid a,c-diamide adenosyltransferase [Acholeplasmataceae bacterium]|jgi:cob(I)alamin adenosyltransferase|nr:cob(I)yrinic acid a,c-diamide adenosyltransferase [Acholeplasmataceae bacterium]MDD2259875.1 cob(I)yrinic acid a,c-diamide adenosyltransferase [Acholeplasmataceae bacterium]MDD4204110.1 cob(I)yrinic acid a,c-diamide adenosyltransferase [Acholeplasmataceae bacterium]MDD4468874.1 cob(I)yrinic acid a,c-diamide adenosyltransferase [Acholeplasmataceae bacterium]MDD4824318.1 cob(I)yrinic acid a,c-diamide adenosyltransferase [Acholeplasmataceae bacterium]
MKIYTKKGDQGETDLIGKRVLKNDLLIQIVGELDELAVRMAELNQSNIPEALISDLKQIDSVLFKIATIVIDINNSLKLDVLDSDVLFLESKINQMEEELPKLKHFITYDGIPSSIKAQLIKTQVRKIERLLVSTEINLHVIKYINRLSDYFFVLGRYLNFKADFKEIIRK